VQNIGFCKMNGDVAVGVGRGVVLEDNSHPIELHNPLVFKNFRRNCSGWRGRKGELPALRSRRVGEVLACVRVRKNGCPRGVHPFVAIGVVKVPMRVDQVLDWVGTD